MMRQIAGTALTDGDISSLFGFLFGSVLAGGSVYSYVLQEYKASNELLTEDIYVRLPYLPALGELGISTCFATISSLSIYPLYSSGAV